MAAFMLESLVLRGVAVRLGALGYLRLGRSVETTGQAPEIIISRQPSGTRPDNPSPNGGPDVVDTTKGTCPGAGRSRRHAGSCCCWATARTTTATPMWRFSGGQAPAAVAKHPALFAGLAASAVEVGSLGKILAAPLTSSRDRSR